MGYAPAMRFGSFAAVVVIVAQLEAPACTSAAPPTSPARANQKPVAPVRVELRTVPLGGQRYDVTLTAVPTADTAEILLTVTPPVGSSVEAGATRARLGRTRAGEPRSLRCRVELAPGGGDVVGSATVRLGSGQARSRAAVATLGPPHRAAPAPERLVTLPTGDMVAEVRR